MSRTVRTFLPLVGQTDALVAAFVGDPARWLPGARRAGTDRFVFMVPARSVARPVSATIGAPRRSGATRWRTLAWEPTTEDGTPGVVDRLLPSLEGELGLHVAPKNRVTLLLDASYQPPGGAVGAAADAIALGRIARATIEQVLSDIAARLGAEALLRADDLRTGSTSG